MPVTEPVAARSFRLYLFLPFLYSEHPKKDNKAFKLKAISY